MKCSKVLMVLAVALFPGMVLKAQSGKPLSLRECVEIGVKNSLLVGQRNLQMQREEVNWRLALGDMLPTLSASVDHNWNSGRNIDLSSNTYINSEFTSAQYNLNSSLVLFNGLRLWNNLRASQFNYEAGKLEWQAQKDNLTLDIILAYSQILNNQDQLELARVQTAALQQQVDRLVILNDQGAILPSDLTDVQAQLANNKMLEINTKNQLETAKLTLVQLMNIPYDSALTVERLPVEDFDMTYSASPDSIYALASEQLAMAKAPELRRKAAEKYVASARGNLIPSVGLGAGAGTSFFSTGRDAAGDKIPYYDQLSNNYGFGVGLGINVPIFNGFFNRQQVKLSKINLKESELVEQTTLIRLKQSIERDYINMQASVNRYRALQEAVAALTQSFQAAEARFNAGVTNSIDFLIARNNLNTANINLILARYDYALRTKILDFYQGRQLF